MARTLIQLAVTAGALVVVAAAMPAPPAAADRAEPVPLYGAYDTFLDHSQQTFDGQPRASAPSTQAAAFTTNCDAAGCTAHWLLVEKLAETQCPFVVRLSVGRRPLGVEFSIPVPLR